LSLFTPESADYWPVLRTASARYRATCTFTPVDFWFDYRRVWGGHPLILAYGVLVVVVFVLAIVGTFLRDPLAILFVPALAGAYVHHLMVMKRLG
jgi:uncharacterized membrane protein AbrB (regulator of aidB expression)